MANMKPKPAEVVVSMEGACALSLECWRLTRIAASLKEKPEATGLQRAVRSINESLEGMGMRTLDFAGRVYDPGMVPEVIDVRDESGSDEGCMVVDETVVPTMTWHGTVVEPGKIILRRSKADLKKGTL